MSEANPIGTTTATRPLGVWGQVLPIAMACAWPFVQFLSQNARETLNWSSVLVAFAVSLGAFLLVLLCLRVVLRRAPRYGIVNLVLVACVLFFSYNAVSILFRDVLEFPKDELGFVKERSILIAWFVVLALLLVLTWLLGRGRATWLFLTTVVGIGLGLATINLALGWLAIGGQDRTQASTAPTEGSTLLSRPNVYFFIFDAYARGDALQRLNGFENAAFLSAMGERGFYLADRSYANYPKTFLSIGSTFNMDYLVSPGVGTIGPPTSYSLYLSGKNRVVETFKQQGYRFILAPRSSISCVGYEDVCVRGDRSFGLFTMGETEINLLRMTPLLAVIRKFAPDIVTYEDIFPEVVKAAILRYVYGPGQSAVRPSFVFYHNLAAHSSQYGNDCDRVSLYVKQLQSVHDLDEVASYLKTIECLNEKILDLVDAILSRDPEAIIVVQSDHGVKFSDWGDYEAWSGKDLEDRFGVLNLIKLPQQCRTLLYPTISPVNTFRSVLGCLRGEEPELLDDRSYWVGTHDNDRVELWKVHEK